MRCAKCGRFLKPYAPKWALSRLRCATTEDLKVRGLDAAPEEMVAAIRADKVVGKGTCSSIDECHSDEDLEYYLDKDGITTIVAALKWAREQEGFFQEQGLNQRWGEDDDPQLVNYRDFEKANKENPVDKGQVMVHLLRKGVYGD